MAATKSQYWNPCISGLATPQHAVTSGSGTVRRRPLRTTLGPSSLLSAHLPASSDQSSQNTTARSPGRSRFLNDSPRQIFPHEARPLHVADIQPSWWCVNMFCAKYHDRHIYTTCDGWKRHMNEHETVWACMPYGPLETAGDDLICALCGSTNPNECHLADHFIRDCADTSTKVRGVSRRANLVKHLQRFHAVSNDRSLHLATKWKITVCKKHFACGFCICIFSTIRDQLNHIDVVHFKKGQPITEWSATKVIRGLLLSPKVASSFKCILLSDPYAIDRDLHWDCHMIENLQRRLEMAEDAAETLAFEAYQMLAFNLDRQKSDGQHPPMSLSDPKFAGQRDEAIDAFDVSAESLKKDSEHQVEDISHGSEPPWFSDEYHVAVPSTSFSVPSFGFPSNQSDTSMTQCTRGFQRLYPMAQRGLLAVSPSDTARAHPVYFSAQTGSASNITELNSASAYNSSDTGNLRQVTSLTTPCTLYHTESPDLLGEQPKIHQGLTPDTETAGMVADLGDLAQLSHLEGDAFPLETCDPRDLIKNSR